MDIPRKFERLVRQLVAANYVEKRNQVALLDRTVSPEHPFSIEAHLHLEEARELNDIVNPRPSERAA